MVSRNYVLQGTESESNAWTCPYAVYTPLGNTSAFSKKGISHPCDSQLSVCKRIT